MTQGFLKTITTGGRPTLQGQPHDFRDSWLAAATEQFRPVFEQHGHPLPVKIRFSVAFTSKGMRSNRVGEHWGAWSSSDGYHTVIIRADLHDPLAVLGVLAHELVHAALPPDAKHGPKFKALATTLGLEGRMTSALPGAALNKWLSVLIAGLGPMPHSKLIFPASRKKAKGVKMVKLCCEAGYEARVPMALFESLGAPVCPCCDSLMLPPNKD